MSLIVFNKLDTSVRGKSVLKNISWSIEPRQNWVIVGPNGAGKTSLLNIILGKLYYRGDFFIAAGLREHTSYVSFDRHSALIRKEAEKDHARHFSGRLDEGLVTPASLLLASAETTGNPDRAQEVISLLGIRSILNREIRRLSTGEMRKLLIADALIKEPELLILDEPYEGLDPKSARTLIRLTDHLMASGIQVLLVTHRFEEIPAHITHALCLKNGTIFRKGPAGILREKQLTTDLYPIKRPPAQFAEEIKAPAGTVFDDASPTLIHMVDVSVIHGRTPILDHVDWQVNKGENWYIVGPNGAGKSTLIRLITADEPQAYANEIYLFGKRRGTGESIWDIKQKIGLISSEFQIQYRGTGAPITAFQVVLSGFFDSIGLFRNATEVQRRIAGQWLRRVGMEEYGERAFAHLSYGEQRMILIVRAMVKSPAMLILDEPFEGLDHANRRMLLALIDDIGKNTDTSIIYVTHQRDRLECITHRIEFVPGETGGYRVIKQKI
ncbi:MAG: ATP-binding cassette domain-containing protein [Deltaproteobacteria bacterium]|nr:ATP-binding cassette domain-containing protein [Deltaproteobacteria bacterium]